MKKTNKKFTFELRKGNVRNTLTSLALGKIDLAMIGSGNSIKTVEHEYAMLKHVPIVVMDHFFTKDDDDKTPPEEYHGVKNVFDAIPTKKVDAQETTEDGWTVFDETTNVRKYVLPSSDNVVGGGHTHLCLLLSDESLPDCPDELKRVPVIVHPRDCVPKEYIRDNIVSNMKLLNDKKWVSKHPIHKGKAILVSVNE
jgi:hypothetical protein